ncbi:MAG: hypothetical protein CM15mP103_08820 [Gammaproteobacteria bacterium]|nr:MAG: hypothetical protein CM15mP103_08820 [Gammaproteobacteria bacterium]
MPASFFPFKKAELLPALCLQSGANIGGIKKPPQRAASLLKAGAISSGFVIGGGGEGNAGEWGNCWERLSPIWPKNMAPLRKQCAPNGKKRKLTAF